MDPIEDLYSRNGVLPAEKKPGRKKAADTGLLWERVLRGDKIRVTESNGVPAGTYEVDRTDSALFRGEHSLGIRLTRDDWVENGSVQAIVERDGKPYTGPGAEATKVTSPGSLLKPATIAPVPQEPVWKRAKVGNKVRVARGSDHPAGEFVVTVIRENARRRVAVDYQGRNGGTWWIDNDKVEAIVGEGAPAVTPIRGNCLIHVDVPTILSNREKAEHRPVVVARRLSKLSEPETFRELAWDGPSRFVHHEFIRIDGTDIQNWVETDSVLTCWRDGEGIKMLDPMASEPVVAKPMTKLILGAFVIHIAAPVLMRNRREGRNDPVIAVRQAHSNWANDVVFGRRVEWSGPSRMVHRPSTPIPGTDGRGVSFIETDADITVYRDDAEPLVLRMPLRAAA